VCAVSPQNVALLILTALPLGLGWWSLRTVRRARARKDDAPVSRVALLAGNALVLAFLLSVAALGGELYFRFVFHGTDSFGLLESTKRWVDEHYAYNSDKLRDDVDYDLGAVPAGKRRITIVGDSFTAGHGVPDVADRFANRLRAARPEWEIHVLARNGWDTPQEVEFVTRQVPRYTKGAYEFDVVLLVFCLNDIVALDPDIGQFGRRLEKYYEKGAVRRASSLADVLGYLWVLTQEEKIRGYFPHLLELFEGPVWDTEAALLRDLDADVERLGGRLTVATFPMMHRLGEDYPLRAAHEIVDAFCSAEDVPHLDLLTAFEGEDASDLVCSALDAHPNERAHALAAEALLEFLDEVTSD